jgi:hypothetical protein
MLALLRFFLAVIALPFKSRRRLEAENAVVCTENLIQMSLAEVFA